MAKMSGTKVTREGPGLDTLFLAVAKASAMSATAGIHRPEADQKYENGATIGEVAIYQEFGTIHIPARSFVRRTFFEDQKRISKAAVKAFAKATGTISRRKLTDSQAQGLIDKALGEVAKEAADAMVEKIDTARNWAKPNAPRTIAKKGFDLPLIDTGQMRRAVTWRVERGGTVREKGEAKS
jgi:hypothetical protein